jgi:hypothetical protein
MALHDSRTRPWVECPTIPHGRVVRWEDRVLQFRDADDTEEHPMEYARDLAEGLV